MPAKPFARPSPSPGVPERARCRSAQAVGPGPVFSGTKCPQTLPLRISRSDAMIHLPKQAQQLCEEIKTNCGRQLLMILPLLFIRQGLIPALAFGDVPRIVGIESGSPVVHQTG